MEVSNDVTAAPVQRGKRKAVDKAFERIFGYKFGTVFDLGDDSAGHSDDASVLVRIFGRTKAARILGQVSVGTSKRRRIDESDQTPKDVDMAKSPPPVKLLSLDPQTSKETRVFAGQQVQVDVSAPPSNGAQKAAPKSNLDNVLAQLSGPGKVNTVQKTSNDWETFKQTDKTMQEQLEKKAQSKDAFLVKKDFLSRVDNRKFELEKEERDRERAKRMTS